MEYLEKYILSLGSQVGMHLQYSDAISKATKTFKEKSLNLGLKKSFTFNLAVFRLNPINEEGL